MTRSQRVDYSGAMTKSQRLDYSGAIARSQRLDYSGAIARFEQRLQLRARTGASPQIIHLLEHCAQRSRWSEYSVLNSDVGSNSY